MSDHHLTAARGTARRSAGLSRRRFLQGVGACVALPALPSLAPLRALAAEAIEPAAAPIRMAFVTFPNGANQDNWWPSGSGADFQLNQTMAPLAGVQQHVQVISGLDQVNALAGSDGGGDHARGNATLLTGARAKKTAGADIHLGISVDQVAAQRIGHRTRFASLELTCDPERMSRGCDSGYACAYQFNVSWRSAETPMPPEPNPRLVFERLFGAGTHGERNESFRRRQATQRSILDFVRDDARSLSRTLSRRDRHKLDEYLTSVREIEQRLEHVEDFGQVPDPDVKTPEGIPADVGEHMDLMYDLLLLAFQTDSTRVATLMLGHDGDNRSYPHFGVSEGHHEVSHHRFKPELLEKLGRIDRHHVQHFARLLEKLAATPDVDGRSLLENSMIVYAGGNGDPNNHTHTNLPIVLAGHGGGTLRAGRYLRVPSQPMCNMFLSMLDRMGVDAVERFGDSTGRLELI